MSSAGADINSVTFEKSCVYEIEYVMEDVEDTKKLKLVVQYNVSIRWLWND